MADRTAAAPIQMAARLVALVAAAAILAVATAAPVAAQTSTAPTARPTPPPDPFQTPSAAKTTPVKRTKSCSSYGDGFVYVPGTDTCVKAGGYLSIDAGGSGR
jgi:hypothetical protein